MTPFLTEKEKQAVHILATAFQATKPYDAGALGTLLGFDMEKMRALEIRLDEFGVVQRTLTIYGVSCHILPGVVELSSELKGADAPPIPPQPKRVARKPPAKVTKLLFQEAGSKCIVCGQTDVSALTTHHIIPFAEHPCHDPNHMCVLCGNCHAKADRKEISREALYAAKRSAQAVAPPSSPSSARESPSVSQTVGGSHNKVRQTVNLSPRIVRKTVVQYGPDYISGKQALRIREAIHSLAVIDEKAGLGNTHSAWYGRLYHRFDVQSYMAIPATQLDAVIAWLQQQGARQRPRLRRTNNPAWRNSLYKAIWARAAELGMSKEAVYALADDRLGLRTPIGSLTELRERQLKTLYDAVIVLPRR